MRSFASGVLVLLIASGCGGLRRRGTPIDDWPGGQYVGAECNRVLCIQHHPYPDDRCRNERPTATVADRVLMAVCVPRTTVVRGTVSPEYFHFRHPELDEAHRAFDDHDFTQLEAALIATSIWRNGRERAFVERSFLRSLYASLVTDDDALRAELAQVAGLLPEAREAFIALVHDLARPPGISDRVSLADQYLYSDVPRQVIAQRQAEYAAQPEAYQTLDELLERAERDIAMGQVRPDLVAALTELRDGYDAQCGGCAESPLVTEATGALIRLHVSLDQSELAAREAQRFTDTPYRPSMATAIWAAQQDAVDILAEREQQVTDMVARGMNEAAARQRVGAAGTVRLDHRSVFSAPASVPDPAP